MNCHDVIVTLQSRNNRDIPATSGVISQVEYDKTDRTKNALKTLGMWIAFTFLSVFIPILHFILVPSLFITSFVLALDKLREDKRNEGGSGECPVCHGKVNIQKSKWAERFVDVCDHCHSDLEMHVVLEPDSG